jgi:hypothetical protein
MKFHIANVQNTLINGHLDSLEPGSEPRTLCRFYWICGSKRESQYSPIYVLIASKVMLRALIFRKPRPNDM